MSLSQNQSHHTAMFILTYEGKSEHIFSFIGFSEIVQYRKILHTCIILIYMAIYFSQRITQDISCRNQVRITVQGEQYFCLSLEQVRLWNKRCIFHCEIFNKRRGA